MARSLTAEDLLAGSAAHHTVEIPAGLFNPAGGAAGEVVVRPLTVRDIQRVSQAAREQAALTSVLMVQQALVRPAMTVEQVSGLPAGLVEFLLEQVNRISGLGIDGDALEEAVRAPLARACFVLSKEFGWTPDQCAQLTLGQVLVYLEMLARGEAVGTAP
ncbi:MAG: hypothetical protein ABI806_03865 [Candidatus Solibacter sp.]